MKHKPFTRFLSLLLVVATLAGLFTLPASAASLNGSGTVNIQYLGRHEYLSKSTGGSLSGSSWSYTSNDGLTGTAYCVNWGLSAVSPNKALTLQEYNRNPQTMGVFANGYPMRTLEQFKELHPDDVRGIASLTEDEYKYATQVAVWASCGQLSVPGTSFTAGRAALVEPTADAQKIRVYDSVKAMLKYSAHWTKNLYTGLSIRAEEDKDVRGVEVLNEDGLEGAAADNEDGIKAGSPSSWGWGSPSSGWASQGLTPASSLGCSSSGSGISSTACRSAASRASSISPSTNSRWVSFRPVR